MPRKTLTFHETDGIVRWTIVGEFTPGGYGTVAAMCVTQAVTAFRACGCAGCRAAEPHFLRAFADLRAAVAASAVANGDAAATDSDVGRA